MKDNTQKIFEGSTEFDDGNFALDYVLYVDKAKASLLALLSNSAQGVEPKMSARSSSKQDETTRSIKVSEAQSPELKPEPSKSELKPEPSKFTAPTRIAPAKRPPEPEPVISPVEVEV